MTDSAYRLPIPAWFDRHAYPFGHKWMPLGDGAVHYVDEGAGRPMLFVHGTPTWSFDYRHLIRALSPEMRCIAPDHLGFGLSERPAAFPYTPEAHARVLATFVDRLDLQDITLVVHDFGGPIGLPLALGPSSRVTRVVIINTWMWSLESDRQMRLGGALLGSVVGRFLYKHANLSLRVIMPSAYGDRRRLTPELHRQYLEVFRDKDARVRVLHALARALNGSRAYYQSLWERVGRLAEIPVLIVWGMKDTAFKPHILERWSAALPNADVSHIEQAGHWPHEEAPTEVAALLHNWLVRVLHS